MEFSRADYLCGTGQKAFIAALMPKHPLYMRISATTFSLKRSRKAAINKKRDFDSR
jgi:arginine/ornithine N-succinyltransferase beta subunit